MIIMAILSGILSSQILTYIDTDTDSPIMIILNPGV